jgi:hypothetical protein
VRFFDGDNNTTVLSLGISRFGVIDMRAQAEVLSALRTDTPRNVKGCLWHSDVDDPL